MRLEVDGQAVDPERVTYNPGVGFGKFDSDRVAVHRYELFMDRAGVIAGLSDAYSVARDEIRADDQKFGEVSEFSALGYVDLDEAFDAPSTLAEIIDVYFCRELLDLFVPVRDRFAYVINSVDRVSVTPEGVLYEGRCFRHLRDDPSEIPGGGGAVGVPARGGGYRGVLIGALQAAVLAGLLVVFLHDLVSPTVGPAIAVGVAVGTIAALRRRRDRRKADWLSIGIGAGIGAAAGTWLGTILLQ